MSLPERLQAGEAIDLDALLRDRDGLSASVVRAGGLLSYGQQHLHTQRPAVDQGADGPPRTLFEKILARHWIQTPDTPAQPTPGQGGFTRAETCRWT